MFYEVIVGNVGKVHDGYEYGKAYNTYLEYVVISRRGIGRCGGENITLWEDGEIIGEYCPSVDMVEK